jgi:DNA mismatch endonuclease (patch repair protein)
MKKPLYPPPSEARSRNMAAIRSTDTKPEIMVRRLIHGAGFRFRKNPRGFPGRPDLVLPRHRVVVFVHGCFWHGHTCIDGHVPKTNSKYWGSKIEANAVRDRRNAAKLRRDGWRVFVLRECKLAEGSARLLRALREAATDA